MRALVLRNVFWAESELAANSDRAQRTAVHETLNGALGDIPALGEFGLGLEARGYRGGGHGRMRGPRRDRSRTPTDGLLIAGP